MFEPILLDLSKELCKDLKMVDLIKDRLDMTTENYYKELVTSGLWVQRRGQKSVLRRVRKNAKRRVD